MWLRGVFFVLLISFVPPNALEDVQCGQRIVVHRGNIVSGLPVLKGEFPWLVAFWFIKQDEFFCSGSLISKDKVVSAAHCFHNKFDVATAAENVLAKLGKHNFNISDETGSQNVGVNEIVLHPQWNFQDEKFDSDICIIFLNNEVTFSNYIQPVCLPRQSVDDVFGNGVVAGWGRSESSVSKNYNPTPSKIIMPVLKADNCYTNVPDLAKIATVQMFCAGFINQAKGVCLGDSGGGFYINDDKSLLWNIRGIVSSSLIDRTFGCDVNKPALYTNVGRFVDWIKEVMSQTRRNIWENVEFDCWSLSNWNCVHKFNGTITKYLRVSTNLTTQSAQSIERLQVYFQPSNRIFSGLGQNFPNLKQLWVEKQSIEFLDRANFENLILLEKLILHNNPIKVIAEDTFYDMPKIRELSLENCKIEKLPANAFKNLKKLQVLYLGKNKLTHLQPGLFANNLDMSLLWINRNKINRIDVNFTKIPYLDELNLSKNVCINLSSCPRSWCTVASVQDIQNSVDRNCKA